MVLVCFVVVLVVVLVVVVAVVVVVYTKLQQPCHRNMKIENSQVGIN